MKTFLLQIVLFISFVSFVYPQSKDEFKQEFRIAGTIFTGWEFNVDNSNFISKLDSLSPNSNSLFGYNPAKNQFETNQNSFFLERAFLTVFASLTPSLKARLTSDIYSLTDGVGKTQYQLGVKFAWVSWTPLKNDNGTKLDFTFGIIPNQWPLENEKYYSYRGFAKTLTDMPWITSVSKNAYQVNRASGSYFPTSDIGANVTFSAPNNLAEAYINIFNGNGFRNLGFDNRFKDIEAIAFIHPFASELKKKASDSKARITGTADVTLGGYAYIGKMGLGENYKGAQYVRNRFGSMIHYKYNFNKSGFFKIGAEYSMQFNNDPSPARPDSVINTSAAGLSTYFEFNPPIEALNEKLMLIARYDFFDPDNSNSTVSNLDFNNNTDRQTFMMLGLAYKPSKMFTLGISYQQFGYQLPFIMDYENKTSDKDSKLIFHSILEF